MADDKQAPEQRCETCFFYVSGTAGHCNRYPPQVLFNQNTARSPADIRAVFPNVESTDWCGEWKTAGPVAIKERRP